MKLHFPGSFTPIAPFVASLFFVLCAGAGAADALEIASDEESLHGGPGETLEFHLAVTAINDGDQPVEALLEYADQAGWAITAPDRVEIPALSSDPVAFAVSVRVPTHLPPVNDFITVTATFASEQASTTLLARANWYARGTAGVWPVGATVTYDPATGRFFLFGGTDNENIIEGLASYDPDTDAWDTTLAEPPVRASTAGACRLGRNIYVVGGILDDWITMIDDLQIYDIDADTWTTGPPMGEPEGLSDMGIACDPDRGRVWVVSGIDSTYAMPDTVRYYDVAQNTWVSQGIAPFPVGFAGARAVYYAGTIRAFALSFQAVYLIADNAWWVDSMLPIERIDAAYDIHDGVEYIAGGWHFGTQGEIISNPSTVFRSLDRDGAWETQDLLPPEALGPTAGGFDDRGRFFLFGGFTAGYGFGGVIKDVYEYPFGDPPASDHWAGESAQTEIAWDDGHGEVFSYINCTPCADVQQFKPKLYPVRVTNFSWFSGDNNDGHYAWNPPRVIAYWDDTSDGVPQSDTPIYVSEPVAIGEDYTWQTVDLSGVPEFFEPIESGELYVGLVYPQANTYRPFIGFDAGSAPVNRYWYWVQDHWLQGVSQRKIGTRMMRVGVEFLGTIPTNDDDLDDDTADDDVIDDDTSDDDVTDDDTTDDDATDDDIDDDGDDDFGHDNGDEDNADGPDEDDGGCCGC